MTRWLVGLSLAAALATAGCGGGSDDGAGERLSKKEFVAKAEAICRAAHEEEASIEFPETDPSKATGDELDQFGDAVAHAAEVDRKEIEDLRALRPPEAFQATFEEAMQEFSLALDHADKAVAAARKGDGPGMVRELTRVQPGAGKANAKAEAYGLRVCSAL